MKGKAGLNDLDGKHTYASYLARSP